MGELPTGWKGQSKEYTKSVGKSHEKTIHEAEGNVSRHKPEAVKEAKHVFGLQAKAQKNHERRENGGADPTGCCGE